MESQPPEKIQAVLVYIRLAVGAARDFRSLACEGLISHCIWETSTDRRGCIWIENTTDPIKVGCTSKYTYSVCVWMRFIEANCWMGHIIDARFLFSDRHGAHQDERRQAALHSTLGREPCGRRAGGGCFDGSCRTQRTGDAENMGLKIGYTRYAPSVSAIFNGRRMNQWIEWGILLSDKAIWAIHCIPVVCFSRLLSSVVVFAPHEDTRKLSIRSGPSKIWSL